MAGVKIDTFFGISPRVDPTLLADGMATTAHNCRLKNGKLVPLKRFSTAKGLPIDMEGALGDLSDARSLHIWRLNNGSSRLVAFPGVTWMAHGNIADDTKSRVIVSGDTDVSFVDEKGKVWNNTPQVFMMDEGVREIHAICKNPLRKPSAARVGGALVAEADTVSKGYHTVSEINESRFGAGGSVVPPEKGWVTVASDSGTISLGTLGVVAGISIYFDGSKWILLSDVQPAATVRYTYFFWTWVDEEGYESPVSEASDEIVYNDGDSVSFAGSDEIPHEAVLIRVYKVITGVEDGRIQFIHEEPVSGGSVLGFTVTVKDEDAGEIIHEIESPPPDIRNICDVPGGYYCGFSRSFPKTVCFSDVDLLYSWPTAFRYDISDNIVTLAVTSNTVFALTDGWPYVLNGTDPSGMTVTKIAGPAACLSERGVCVYRNAVYYVSQQGLMAIYNDANAGTVCANVTDKVFTKEQWLALNPKSCVMGQHDGALFMFFEKEDGECVGLVFDTTETACAITTHDEYASCVCVDNASDKMYYIRRAAR